ncbi:MAG: GrpB family protein [Proteobacteria bacterium]|uniref:GrpB family protein n=1 Tax=Thermomonas beijingensis TaxID=2872701 RepID=A0ABS7TGQ2_9GAMM|nr:GrpB family protein [Pseudomonadota bacterium]MBZ4187013.1 GrpB family protein [Thermomonas beijingensis]
MGFRDALRADARLAQEYAQLKLSLAGKYRDDREAYTHSKTKFVQQVLQSVGLAQASET